MTVPVTGTDPAVTVPRTGTVPVTGTDPAVTVPRTGTDPAVTVAVTVPGPPP